MSAQHDLIIVGGGIAGLTAAVRAIELGIQPLVLEKKAKMYTPVIRDSLEVSFILGF